LAGTLRSFQINEKVGFLYEKGGGTVRRIDERGFYVVEDESGFERPMREAELVRIHGSEYHLPDDSVAQINEDDTISSSRHTIRKENLTGSRRPIDVWEIDLHIESLLDSHAGMSNAEILNVQLRELRTFYKRATGKHIRKIIIIHGVGEGVLKDEVRLFLSKKEGIEYYDADFREYGKGATAVEIRYNIH
jgi:DNA-nicking Smr family endonuclease